MHCEAERLNRLISNVLDFARLEKSRPTVERRPLAVRELLDQLKATWEERCAAAGKELVIEDHLPPDAIIETDRKLIEQILGNLIDNAQKYSRESSDPRIWIRAKPDKNRIHFEIEDRGPGISQQEQSWIFRAFRRGNDADVKAGGVGLGLALATRWASFISGRLEVDTAQGGVGACFRLILSM
jgi:K+-sensing histidine kinase KdpD